jgi:hypothetical protein
LFRQNQHEQHFAVATASSRHWVTAWFQALAPKWLRSTAV